MMHISGRQGSEAAQYKHTTSTTSKQRIWTTMTVTRIVARDDAREFSTSCGNFAPKKVTTLCVTSTGPNLLYKILFLRNRNRHTGTIIPVMNNCNVKAVRHDTA